MSINRDWKDYCDICEARKIGIVTLKGITFCKDCGKRELEHNQRRIYREAMKMRWGFGK